MSPPDRRRRRVRPSVAVAIVASVLVLAALIGGLAEVGSVSKPYWRSVDRSYATQGAVLADQSNENLAQLRQLLTTWTGQSRRSIEATLDLLVRTTARTAQAAASLSPPAPWGTLGSEFTTALADRARAMVDLRRAVDGLLGMAPLPVATAGGPTGTNPGTVDGGSGPVHLTAAQAASGFGTAGTLLEQSDRTYADVRHGFGRAPGRPTLPASRWVTDPATWSAGPALTLADQLAGSPQLAPVQQVVLLPSAVSITPAPVPGAQAGASVLPPTRSVTVTVVVDDEGNVAERGLPVSVAIEAAGSGIATHRTTSVTLAAGASRAVRLSSLPVRPGQRYQLIVTLNPPSGEVPGSMTTRSFAIAVAPSASPPATTTTTTTSPAKHHSTTTTTRPATTTSTAVRTTAR